MRLALASIALILAMLLCPSTGVRADVIYDNGAPPFRSFAYSMTESIQADDFELSQAGVITGIRFYTLEQLHTAPSTGYSGSIWWSIQQDHEGAPSGSALAGDETQDVSRVFTGILNDDYKNGAQAINTIEIAPLALEAGRYWLLLHNGPLTFTSLGSSPGFLVWEAPEIVQGLNGMQDSAPFDGTWGATFGDRAFSLIAVPEPNAGLALVGGFVMLFRRQRWNVIKSHPHRYRPYH